MCNAVAMFAEFVDDMQRGTMYGPTRLGLLLRARSAASTWLEVEGPPEPMTMPVRSCETSASVRPASVIARSEEHTSELQSLMRISYAVFCLNTKHKNIYNT